MRRPALVIFAAVAASGAVILAGTSGAQSPPGSPRPFSVVEATLAGMQAAMADGRTSSRDIVQQSLTRIALYEDRLNAVMTVNARALDEADERDRERRAGRIRGPLHGIPIALKDNIHTTDMPTTGGALAFAGLVPPYEATLTRQLRDAGAIVIAKTVMTELANWVAPGMPTNYSALAGFAFNPYDPRRDPRLAGFDGRPVLPTGGSSSGGGTAASFWAANVGTETSGSILSPANQNMLVGIKPTVGRISRYGVIPITADQDTPGPMARTVADAATLLGVLESAQPDPQDAATSACTAPPARDYTRYLDAAALKGARIGVPRAFYYDPAELSGTRGAIGGLRGTEREVMQDAIAVLRERGATLVDPADIPSVMAADRARNALAWNPCSGQGDAKGQDDDCSVVFKYGMKRDFTAWLESLGARAPVRTLAELRAWNEAHRNGGALKYGQAQLDISDEMDLRADEARYKADRTRDLELSRTEGIDAVMREHRLDALLFPGGGGALIARRRGSLQAPPVNATPNGAGLALNPSGSGAAGFGIRPNGTITVG